MTIAEDVEHDYFSQTSDRDWPLVDLPRFEMITTVLRIAQALRSQLSDVLTVHGMTWARYEVLDLLYRQGPAPYCALSRHLDRHRTSVAATVDGLRSSGYVCRSIGPDHSQQWIIGLTGAGEIVLERAERALRSAGIAAAVNDPSSILDVLRVLERDTTPRV